MRKKQQQQQQECVCECVRQLAQPDVHSAASTLPINEQGLGVIA